MSGSVIPRAFARVIPRVVHLAVHLGGALRGRVTTGVRMVYL